MTERNETKVRPWLWNLLLASVCAAIGFWLIGEHGSDGVLYYLPVMLIGMELQR